MRTKASEEQISALKLIILNSLASRKTKKILFALIAASDMLTKSVAYTLYSPTKIRGISDGFDIDEINLFLTMKLMGITSPPHQAYKNLGGEVYSYKNWTFFDYDGYFLEGKFKEDLLPDGQYALTIWLSLYDRDIDVIKITEEDVEKVELVS